ncbi:41162_t:CDS:1, partial [Gigaspora margarita]
SAEGRILYEKTEKHAYVYDTITQKRFSSFLVWIKALSHQWFFKGKKSALATIFLKPNCYKMNIGQIIKGKNYSPYFKNIQIVILLSIKDTLTTIIYNDIELTGINLMEGKGFLCLTFFETNLKKELYIKKTIHECWEPIKCTIF